MNTNSRTFWISFGCAVFAMFLVYGYAQEQKAIYDKKFGSTKTVLVAKKDILEMATLDDSMIELSERPTDFIQPGDVSNPDDVLGLVAAVPIKKGEQILLNKLLSPGPNTGLAIQVAPGKRAITLAVDEIRGVGKLIKPGDRVDIITSISYGSGQQERREVKTLMQDVQVLATGVNVTNNIPRALQMDSLSGKPVYRNLNGDTGYTSVTVEVDPTDAQNLIYIQSVAPGAIFLSLRNVSDVAKSPLSTSTIDTVLGSNSDRALQRKLQEQAIKNVAKPQQGRAPTFIEIKGSDVRY